MLKMCSTPLINIGKPRVARFDSDTMLITDNETLIRCASKYYSTFKVPTMVVESSKIKRRYTNADKANLDKFCDNDNIGVIVNLSQELNSKLWHSINHDGNWAGAMKAYYDNCLLSVLSGLAIDMAKREYPIDCMEELQLVRTRYDDRDNEGRAIRPYFFAHVAKKKGFYDSKKKNYKRHMAPMDYVQDIVNRHKNSGAKYRHRSGGRGILSIGEILTSGSSSQKSRNGYVDLVLAMVRSLDSKTRMLYQANSNVASPIEKRKLASAYFDNCVEGIRTMQLNEATMRELLVAMDEPCNADIRRKLWSILFGSFGKEFSNLLIAAKEPVSTIEECAVGEDGDLDVFWLKFRYVSVA